MAKTSRRLTDRATRGGMPEGRHPDGDGLYLVVAASGARSWIFRHMFKGRRRDVGMGSLLDVSLAQARDACADARRELRRGVDPFAARLKRRSGAGPDVIPEAPLAEVRPQPSSASPAGEPTLGACWSAYVTAQEGGWRGRKTRDGWMRSIDRHAALIRDLPVADIDTDAVMSVLQPLWLTKAESAGKLRERLERVLDYARVKGLRSGENPARWKGNLFFLLPPRPKLQRGHMAALPYEDVPGLMVRLRSSQGMSARALEFTILTVAREMMTLEATWGEVSEDLWTLDASRMKERAFRQPLSSGALELLARLEPPERRANLLIFPGPKGGVMSNMAMDMMLRDLAPGFTPHGMRSSFRDWAGDETEFAKDVIEECLAHTVGDETERAYRRRDALRKRREVLQAWSDHCMSLVRGCAMHRAYDRDVRVASTLP
ncbi:MAG: integrase arm-type DNA-binding domain-containing protein [Brevundimonas sp.]|uniref:tyrosine-type recombinase/integrase n=1 Tax=Brevundimonas sp. TaxID=1871086 RepID=UPI00273232D8|nr:integrase arm-type DNA-binding domain-containing protein [Brevundimonas sp.]MDP3403444.1 integrase arm-type DNA-binding domain-containing protein [Brevundimonas sp.]